MSELTDVVHGYLMAGNIIFGEKSDAYFQGLRELLVDWENDLISPDYHDSFDQDEQPTRLYPPYSPPSAE